MITGAQIRKARELLRWALRDLPSVPSSIRPSFSGSVDGEPPITVYHHALIRDTLERFGIELAGVKMRQMGKADR